MNDPLAHWLANPPATSEGPPVGEAARRLQRRSTILDWFQIGALALIPVVLFLAFRMDHRAENADKRATKVANTVSAFRQLALCSSPADCQEARRKLEALGQPAPARPAAPPVPSTTSTTRPSADRPSSTAPAASPGRSPATAASQPSPPATAAPAPSGPSPSPSSTTTSTTCLASIGSRCLTQPPLAGSQHFRR